jgi:hypothetical protein
LSINDRGQIVGSTYPGGPHGFDLAPDFFKEFTTRNGLSINRYWREAVSRAGEVRSDRKTIPMLGALVTHANIERLLRVVEYGQRQLSEPPIIVSVPPQNRHWGATSLLRDAMSALLGRKVSLEGPELDEPDRTICVMAGRPPKYLEYAFDRVETIETIALPPALELLVMPQVCVYALVHAPIGLQSGIAAPLGFASFDKAILKRTHSLLLDGVIRYMKDVTLRSRIERAMSEISDEAAAG